MPAARASEFYTGLVAELYTPLKSTSFRPDRYRELIGRFGEPALELGCGDGDPLLDLRETGLDVDGIDSSPDMIERLHRRAASKGVSVEAWVADMASLRAPRTYRTVFLAGPTFNLLPDDGAMAAALAGIASALADGGTAIVPLFVPEPVAPDRIGAKAAQQTATGSISCQTVAAARDEDARTQTVRLRYQQVGPSGTQTVERDWLIHWIDLARFAELARQAGLQVASVSGEIGPEPVDVVLRAA